MFVCTDSMDITKMGPSRKISQAVLTLYIEKFGVCLFVYECHENVSVMKNIMHTCISKNVINMFHIIITKCVYHLS